MQKYRDAVLDRNGNAVVGATVTVSQSGVSSTVYATDAVGANANPLTTDANGEFSFYALAGTYDLTITKTGMTTKSVTGIVVDDSAFSTWTPVLTFVTPGNLSVAYSTQYGDYTRAGREVCANFSIVTSTFTHTTASGNLTITGLPFMAPVVTGYLAVGSILVGGITKATYTHFVPTVLTGTQFIGVSCSGSGVAAADITAADMPSAGTVRLRGSIRYRAS